ncbi:MAG TPA: peptidylprolyl isomerase [Crenotrichaceae bacterium]|nr:peptidylprolyl isomerase [Crenotrichaceae bacterium]
MLQVIRKHVHGLLGWFVLGLIIVSFALWGISSYFDGGDELPVATVGGKKFFQRDVNRAYLRLKQSNPRLAAMDETILRKEALRQLVSDTVLGDTVNDIGLVVSDPAVKKIIQNIPVFQVDGKFDKKTYKLALARQGLSSRQFIEQTRLALEKDQLRRSSLDSGFVTKVELDDYFGLFNQSRDVAYMTVPIDLKPIDHSDDDIRAYYDEHAEQYQVPEQVSLQYVELNLDDLASQQQATEQDLLAYYEEQKDSFSTEERRKVRHILISTKTDNSEQDALEKAQLVIEKLGNGEDFSELAKQYSDDPLSKKKGGDLGFIRHGDMVQAFEDAVYELQQGVVSKPVKTEYGYHVIQVTEIQPATTKPYAEVKDQIAKDFKRQQAENEFFERQETLDQVRFEHSDSLEMAADAIDVKIQETDLFNQQNGTGIAAEKAVRDAAFTTEVLEGNNSEVIEIDPEHVVVMRIKEHQPAKTLPLETVKQGIIQALNQKAAHEAAISQANAIVKAVKQGQSFDEIASKHGLTVKAPGFVKRDNSEIPWRIKQGIFSTPKPASQPSLNIIDLGPEGQVVVMVKSVQQGDPADIDETMQEQVKASLLKNRNSIEYAALIAQLEQSSDVSIQKELQQ